MARKYTAQEMRDMEENILMSEDDWIEDAAYMLRQCADMMEREEKRKKDYEYSVIAKKHDGAVFLDTEHFSTLEGAMKNAEDGFYDVLRYQRREVGKWEEVSNG